tara:strand:- start:478 stop:978 length:501 start_codon:yes stop_codon:yes gene_type:complete
MPTFPSISAASTANVDQGSDSISLARPDIKTTFDNVNSIITTYNGKDLVASGDVQSYTAQQYFNQATLTADSANALAWNLSTQQVAIVTLTGNSQLDVPTNQQAGGVYTVVIKQDGTGGHTLAFDSIYKFPNGSAPTITTTANAVDIVSFVSDGSNMLGSFVQDVK